MELEILSRQFDVPVTDLPALAQPPKKSAIEQASLLLTIAPSFTMALPMLLGFYLMYRGNKGYGSYLSMGLTMAIGSAVLGALWAGINCIRRQQKMRFAERFRKRSYRAYLKEYERSLREQINYLENIYRNQFPDFTELIDRKKQRVYCFRLLAKEGLKLRLGTGAIPFQVPAEDGRIRGADVLQQERDAMLTAYATLDRVPICAELNAGTDCILVADRSSALCAMLRLVIVRAALTYHEKSLRILFLPRDRFFQKQYSWIPYLPHAISPDETDFDGKITQDTLLLVIMGKEDRLPGSLAGSDSLIRICLFDQGESEMVRETSGVVRIVMTDRFCGLITSNGSRRSISFDTLSGEDATLAARALCSIKDFGTLDGSFPDVYPICRMLGHAADHIAERWQNTDALHSLKVPLGILADQSLLYLDAHDKQDGPHGLIAGMTGSGKSELLITYILSLAVHFPPWEVAFFLIDYKGGGMSSAFANLPHVLGSISNLSGELIQRAFLSIRSENERRQRIFLEQGINHISDYHRMYRQGRVTEALPHIFLIIDEFAQLKTEEPEFMQEVIGLSRVGRSLGIHLLLCTQKPSGSVDATIMTNARFQIALRLQDPMDSRELLRHTDAADLTKPGQAILRIGNDEVYQMFQCAYALSPAKEDERLIYPADAYGRILREGHRQRHDTSGAQTGMEWLLERIRDAARQYPVAIRRLYLDPLPDVLFASEVKKRMGEVPETEHDGRVLIGLFDDAASVIQGPLYLSYREGHHLICGMPGSGKSTLLAMFLQGLLKQEERPKIAALDFGGGMLAGIAGRFTIPCIGEEDYEKTEDMLTGIRDGQQETVILLDGIQTMLAQCSLAMHALFMDLLRGRRKYGLTFLITANAIGMTQMSQDMHSYMARSLCLRQQDPYRYTEVLRDAHFRGETTLAPGHGYVRINERIVEFATMIADEEETKERI